MSITYGLPGVSGASHRLTGSQGLRYMVAFGSPQPFPSLRSVTAASLGAKPLPSREGSTDGTKRRRATSKRRRPGSQARARGRRVAARGADASVHPQTRTSGRPRQRIQHERPCDCGFSLYDSPEQYEQNRNLGSPFSTTACLKAPSGTLLSASQSLKR